MDGLRIWIVLAAICCPCPLKGDQSTEACADSSPTVASPTVAIIGDVSNPNTYHCPEDQILSLRDALNAAGMVSESAAVLLVRQSSPQPWTERVFRDGVDPGPLLLAGDVIVVHGDQGRSQVPATAVLVKDGSPLVLMLQNEVGVPVSVADVLHRCGVVVRADMEFRLISAQMARTQRNPAVQTAIQHGDVLLACSPAAQTGARQRHFLPVVTEWGSSPAHNSADHTVPGKSQHEVEPVLTTASAVQSVSHPVIPAISNSLAFTAADSELYIPPADPDVQRVDEERRDSGSSACEDAPIPPAESGEAKTKRAAKSSYFTLNIFLAATLLTAGCMVIAGWMKAEPPLPVQITQPSALTESSTGTASESFADMGSTELDGLLNSEILIHNSVQRTVGGLYTGNHQSGNQQSGNQQSGVVQKETARHEADALVSDEEWIEGNWRHRPAGPPGPPGPIAEQAPVQHAPDTSSQVGVNFHELNDLIENRLPVDLCTAQLPLRVSLYGRPAGPRRLRIDAAHPQLSGPHLNKAGTRRQETGLFSTATPVSPAATDNAKRTESSLRVDLGSVSETAKSVVESTDIQFPAGSLDRALNFLHEQGE